MAAGSELVHPCYRYSHGFNFKSLTNHHARFRVNQFKCYGVPTPPVFAVLHAGSAWLVALQ